MIEKIECTCIEAYTTRKMRDPNCCACSCDHNDLVEQLAKANECVRELERDKERLDLLDECNAEFNRRCGSGYGWKVDWNHNRIALVDTGIPKTDVRTALDEFLSRVQLRKEQNQC